MRIIFHKLRGVKIGKDVFIGYDTIIDTAYPELVYIGNNVIISWRVLIIAHFDNDKLLVPNKFKQKDFFTVKIEDDAFIGPGSIILPNITIGSGSVVSAGSVVFRSVPPMTMVQGNPAKPIARCGIPLTSKTNMSEFKKNLKPIRNK